LKFIIPVESIVQKKGGVILYDPIQNKILKQYVHDKKWEKWRVGWRGGTIHGDFLIATDWTDLHYFNVKEWKYKKTFKKNTFNDLHYVEVHNNLLFVVNTGLDAIEIFENPMKPVFKDIVFIFNKNKIFEKRKLDLKIEYNKMLKIKPHSCHPNCIALRKNRAFVTCFSKNQRMNSGEIIDLDSGRKICKRNYDCHDGIFYKGDFYTTWTRHGKILKFNKIHERKLPISAADEIITIGGGRGWWRGMIIHDDMAYVFASDGYRKKKTTPRMRIVNLKTKKSEQRKLPVFDGVYWDTVYQPNLWEGK